MLAPSDLRILLKNLVSGVISYAELSRLIQICHRIAEGYLMHQRDALARICALNGLTVSDLAYDCISDAFARGPEENYLHFEKFLSVLQRPLEEMSDTDLWKAFTSFMLEVTKSQLARVYSQADPGGAKILRNIRDALKKRGSLEIRHDFRGAVLSPLNVDPLEHLTEYPIELLSSELCALKSRAMTIPELIREIACIVSRQEDYRRSIPLIGVVQAFKAYYDRLLGPAESTDLGARDLTEEDLQRLRERTLRAINEKIFTGYLMKRKITKPEAEVLSCTMADIVDSWLDGGMAKISFYDLVGKRIGISLEEYEKAWRTRIEYLSKVARESIKSDLDIEI